MPRKEAKMKLIFIIIFSVFISVILSILINAIPNGFPTQDEWIEFFNGLLYLLKIAVLFLLGIVTLIISKKALIIGFSAMLKFIKIEWLKN